MKRPQLNELTLEEKVGQLLLLNQRRVTHVDDSVNAPRMTQEQQDELIGSNHFTGLWCYGLVDMDVVNLAESGRKASIKEHKKWIERVTRTAKIPMLIGVDFENGTGYAFYEGSKVGTGATIGAAYDKELTFKLNASVAREVKAAGANWRWTPVVDNIGRFSASITRTFSDDPDKKVELALEAMHGMESEGIASTIKHFPGGDPCEYRDSHLVSTKNNTSYEDWKEGQGKIFQRLIDAGATAVMVGHSAFPAIDDEMNNGVYVPSSLSKKIVQGLLRDEMGFDGIVITDAIGMTGLQSFCSKEEILIRAINAGNDILLGVETYAFDVVYKAVLDGKIPMSRIDESCERVLKFKEKLGLFEEKQKEEINIDEQIKITGEINRKICEKSITLLYDHNNLLPVSKENVKKVAIIALSHKEDFDSDLAIMKSEFEKRGAQTDVYNVPLPGSSLQLRQIEEECDLIIYAAYVSSHNPMGMPTLYGDKARFIANAFVDGVEKTIGVSLGYPYVHYDMLTGARTFANIYSPAPESQIAFVKAVYGEIGFEGISPVDIEPKLRKILC